MILSAFTELNSDLDLFDCFSKKLIRLILSKFIIYSAVIRLQRQRSSSYVVLATRLLYFIFLWTKPHELRLKNEWDVGMDYRNFWRGLLLLTLLSVRENSMRTSLDDRTISEKQKSNVSGTICGSLPCIHISVVLTESTLKSELLRRKPFLFG